MKNDLNTLKIFIFLYLYFEILLLDFMAANLIDEFIVIPIEYLSRNNISIISINIISHHVFY